MMARAQDQLKRRSRKGGIDKPQPYIRVREQDELKGEM